MSRRRSPAREWFRSVRWVERFFRESNRNPLQSFFKRSKAHRSTGEIFRIVSFSLFLES